jgi:hypothetical protein
MGGLHSRGLLTNPTIFKASWIGAVVCVLAAGLVLAFLAAQGALAQKGAPKAPQPAPARAPPPQPSFRVSTEQAVYLLRSTLATLHDANRSGNYSVLHNLATPDFQIENTPADLAMAFVNLRRSNIDLLGIAFGVPQFTMTPTVDAQGMLRIAGSLPAQPRAVNFDLLYKVVNGQWRLQGIAISMPEAALESKLPAPSTNVSSSLAVAPSPDPVQKPAADAAPPKP